MLLGNVMRRAASLLVEMPAEPEPVEVKTSDVPDLDDIDMELPPEARLSSNSPNVPAAKSIDQIVREADGPNLDQVRVDEKAVQSATLVSGGKVDFVAVYRAAKLPESAFGAEQMLETLASLPSELPLETRRATVKAMLGTLGKTTGATPETIVADASRKLAALESFAAFMEKRTGDTITKAQTEIAELEAQIEARKTAIQTAKNEQAGIVATCEAESTRLDDVLEFFSLDVGGSRLAAPSPGAPSPAASSGAASGAPLNATSGTPQRPVPGGLPPGQNPAHFRVEPPTRKP